VTDAFTEGRRFSAKLAFRQISHLDCLGIISDLLLAAYGPLLSEHIKAASRQNTRKRLSIGGKADRTQVIKQNALKDRSLQHIKHAYDARIKVLFFLTVRFHA